MLEKWPRNLCKPGEYMYVDRERGERGSKRNKGGLEEEKGCLPVVVILFQPKLRFSRTAFVISALLTAMTPSSVILFHDRFRVRRQEFYRITEGGKENGSGTARERDKEMREEKESERGPSAGAKVLHRLLGGHWGSDEGAC